MSEVVEEPAPEKIFVAEEKREAVPETRDEKTSSAPYIAFPKKEGYSWYIAVDGRGKIKYLCVRDGVTAKIEAKRYRSFIPLSKKHSDG